MNKTNIIRSTFISGILLTTLISCASNNLDHTAKKSLDWQGAYQGYLPCANCDGINTKIELNTDMSYSITETYEGKSDKPFVDKGTFNWNHEEDTITLQDESQYKVIEDGLQKLDIEGNEIKGELANSYLLKKI